jgi:hypothetical protein
VKHFFDGKFVAAQPLFMRVSKQGLQYLAVRSDSVGIIIFAHQFAGFRKLLAEPGQRSIGPSSMGHILVSQFFD